MQAIRVVLLIVVIVQSGCQRLSNFTASNPTSTNNPTESDIVKLDAAKWYKYTNKDGKYTALFPGKPADDFQPYNQTEEYSRIRVDYDGQMDKYYAIETTRYFKKISKNNAIKLLKSTIKDSTDGSGRYVLKYQKKINFNGHDTYEYFVADRKWNGGLRSRIFFDMKDSTLYRIWVSTVESSDDRFLNSPQTTFFLDSLLLNYHSN